MQHFKHVETVVNSLAKGEETPKIQRRPKKPPPLDTVGDDLIFDRMSSRIGSWDFKEMEQTTSPSITSVMC